MAAVIDRRYKLFLQALVVGGFVLGADAAGNGFAWGEFGAADFTLFFQLLLGLSAKARPRDGFEAFTLNRLAGQFTHAVGAAADAHHGFVDFVNGILLGGNAA